MTTVLFFKLIPDSLMTTFIKNMNIKDKNSGNYQRYHTKLDITSWNLSKKSQ